MPSDMTIDELARQLKKVFALAEKAIMEEETARRKHLRYLEDDLAAAIRRWRELEQLAKEVGAFADKHQELIPSDPEDFGDA